MQVLNLNEQNPNFGGVRIRIKGKLFKEHPEISTTIRDAIRNNENITDFFKKHTGKIEVISNENIIPIEYDYPDFLRKTPHFIPDTFTVNRNVPSIKINCTYWRAFALRNFFRKPVWINMGTKPNKDTTVESCLNAALELIKCLGKDSPECIKKRGDTLPRDLFSVEARRLKVEKP